jgi:hypothetical protein
MADTYVLLQKINVGPAGVSSVTFSSIPQTGYTDLVVYHSARNTVANANLQLSFNGSGGTAYSAKKIYASNTTVVSNSETSAAYIYGLSDRSTDTASTFASGSFYIPDYTSSSYKSFSYDGALEGNIAATYLYLTAGLWSNTAAITSVTLTPDSGNFAQYSTFSLYGVSKFGTTPTESPYAIGGDIIETDGTYWYHAFLSSAAFTPTKDLSADILCIAGGGGGGGYGGGGGGAGGVIYFTGTSLAANTGYTAIIGSGGAGYTNGGDSKFDVLTSAFGGGGSNNPGNSGGSGGGCGQGSGAVVSGGASTQTGAGATAFYGNAGGNAANGGNFVGGGGGGAGAAGTTSNGSSRGNGGVGTTAFSSWGLATGTGQNSSGTVYYAGGGGGSSYFNPATSGGSGGLGGGGNGSTVNEPSKNNTPGAANTGGGGGATQSNQAPDINCYGGSGIIIVRYLI